MKRVVIFFGQVLVLLVLLGLLVWPLALRIIWPVPHTESKFVRVGFVVIACYFAWGLFYIRKHFTRFYAACELCAGIGAIWTAFATATEMAAGGALAGGIYIIIRGLDNWERGTQLAEKENNR